MPFELFMELKKAKAHGLKVRQDNLALIVGPSSIPPWMMFARVRWLKHQFFMMLDIAKLRSIQDQDADNRISDPTDLAAKLPSNLIFVMLDIVCKRWPAGICKDCSLQIQKAHMLCSLHTHLRATYPTLQFRTACYSDHADWFLTLVLTRLSRFACEIGPICVC